MANSRRISIFGLGYVGAVSLAGLARDYHAVVADIDRAKLDLIFAGNTPVEEKGMIDLMAGVAASGQVYVITDVVQAAMNSDLSLICVGTRRRLMAARTNPPCSVSRR